MPALSFLGAAFLGCCFGLIFAAVLFAILVSRGKSWKQLWKEWGDPE